MDVIPIDQGQRAPGMPSPARDQQDATGQVELDALAKETAEFHEKGLRARRLMNLTAQKYILHVDGEGTSQWLDLHRGVKLKMAPSLAGIPRVQNNQLRPILSNFVAHLTTQPYRVAVQAKPDRESRERAVIDQAVINADIRKQNWNALFAEAKAMAACAGFCPIHSMWRDDPVAAPYEAVMATIPGPNGQQQPMQGAVPGDIDSWVGNPLDTIFDGGARRGSRHRMTYGRLLPAEMVRNQFQRPDLEGTTRLPNASTFQRVTQRWKMVGSNLHGSAALTEGQGHEELIYLIYDEWVPGYHPQWPNGRMSIIAVQGDDPARMADSGGSNFSNSTHLWTGPLPARSFSSVLVYSHHRFDDIHGKPYVGDIDDDQIELNQLESLFDDFIRRATKPPLGSTGAINVETLSFLGDTVLELEPLVGGGSVELKYLEYPARHMPLLSEKINRVLDGMYRKAGWQAPSRGESSGQSGKAIIALQQADDSLFGPTQMRTGEEIEELATLNWKLRREFMDVPMVLDAIGDELAHLAEPYVDRTMMSNDPPVFTTVSGFGTSVEAKAQQLLNMFGMVDAKGEQVLGTRELRKLWPDNSLFPTSEDPAEVIERRPRAINAAIRDMARDLRQQFPQLGGSMSDPMVAMVAEFGALEIDGEHPIMMDDHLPTHIETYSLITQDESEDPLARRIAILRQMQYYEWLAMQQMASAEAAAAAEAEQGGGGSGGPSTEEAFHPEPEASSPGAASMVRADQQAEARSA